MEESGRYSQGDRRPRIPVLVGIMAMHALAIYALILAAAPEVILTERRERLASFDISQPTTASENETAQSEAKGTGQTEPDSGERGDPGSRAVPREASAPASPFPLPRSSPAPRAASTGSANTSGAADAGAGTGAAGTGKGTGAGGDGQGQGGGGSLARDPQLVATISDVRDFEVPPGGRGARVGNSVIVRLGVSAAGRVTSCSVYRPSAFPATDQRVCELSYSQIRFEPALDASGNPIASTFFYRQSFFERGG